MPHLIAQQVRWRVHIRHKCAVRMAQIVILKSNAEPFLYHSCVILHGIYRLDFSVGKRVYQIKR